jgi:aminoglycoside 6'-N-acetyltransferase I
MQIVDLTAERPELTEQAARLLHAAFLGRTEEWQDVESARREVFESLAEGKINRIAMDESGGVIGWIGATPIYRGRVWEIHPLAVSAPHRRRGVGRALMLDAEEIVRREGGLTLFVGADDEAGETTLGGVDLYRDVPNAIRNVRNLKGHPYEFYLRLGFSIVGVVPDANGPGKPDIFLAKRVQPIGRERI